MQIQIIKSILNEQEQKNVEKLQIEECANIFSCI